MIGVAVSEIFPLDVALLNLLRRVSAIQPRVLKRLAAPLQPPVNVSLVSHRLVHQREEIGIVALERSRVVTG